MTRQITDQTASPDAPPPVAACRRAGACSYPVIPAIVLLLRLGLGALFLLAAYQKLFVAKPQIFSASVTAFHVFDHLSPGARAWMTNAATYMTPWTEIVAGLALVLGIWTRAAAAVLGALLVLFIALIARAMYIGLELECGCFGKLSPFCTGKIGWCNIIQNSVMLGAVLVIVFAPRHVYTVDCLMNRKNHCGRGG